jgi:hypothetical protein
MTVRSVTSAQEIRALRDGNAQPVPFFTGDGANGVRTFTLIDSAGDAVDITGKTLKAVIKSALDAADDELDAAFPITATGVVAGAGQFDIDLNPVNFANPVGSAFLVVFDDAGGKRIVEAQMLTSIKKGGV